MKPLYLDYNATTPLDPYVFGVMRPFFEECPTNAGSRTHVYGQRARDAVERARSQVASLISARPEEIIFTSGATESNNAVLLGLIRHGLETDRRHVLATSVEHKSILEPLGRMRQAGFEVDLLPVTSGGYVEPDAVRERLRSDTLLVTMMHANNETGVLQPIAEVAELIGGSGTLFHVDAAQTFGKEVETLGRVRCDFLSLSGHKIYAPQGVGALYACRRGAARLPLESLLLGGGQEWGLRPGTLPVPLVVGLGAAADLAGRTYPEREAQAKYVKRGFLDALSAVDHRINGDLERLQPHVLNVSFPGVDGEALMLALRAELAFSNGAACTSAAYATSHVLRAMGLPEDRILSAARFSWGQGVTSIPTEVLIDAVRFLIS
jgi:cysteine desulfurase